ncbi:nitronate monooxygenase [Rhodococcus qingshengii]|jgi:NAD(P)H-dependent flavin oxidoreductase YrpB (nitropropane dioxygenase family)|uniref:Nitronate monooxygenase n=1 Tax=Rhodococcus erythropolis TaxID=1833 RepID=A0AAX3ZYS2_RHOER|nr:MULTISPECIES: nitronate monooxygenase [Rhodococcus]MCE4268398.1 nitronate monooxygenase [Rhodococcus globerulus]MDJ0491258.1 nitronate monooxygenase [Rhodococcus qingshengii]WMN01736.1 nitronate monooxygenase [Rhodococcus erythropolis]
MQHIANRYTRLVGIEHPVVQEGLGPFRTPKLAAAVSMAGGLGTVSMPGMPVDLEVGARTFREHIEECAALTDRPFAVNIPVGVDGNGTVLPFTDIYIRTVLDARKVDSSLAEKLTVMTTSAGFPGDYISMIKDAGMIHQHKVGSTRQAVKAAEAGVDVVIAAGFEMGGHAPSKAVHTFVLIPSITEAVDIPVLLTGGARDARGLAAALAMGADGVAMGTRFITSTDNSDWHPAYIQAILDAKEGDDVAFDGVYGPCRGLRNAASQKLSRDQGGVEGEVVDAVELTRWKIESMQRAQTDGDVIDGLVLTGQVASAIDTIIEVSEFVPRIAAEAADIIRGLSSALPVSAPALR